MRTIKVRRWSPLAVIMLFVGLLFSAAGPAKAASPDGAIAWANARLGQSIYQGLCLAFVHDAYLYGSGVEIGSAPSAYAYWQASTAAHHSDTNPPVGALVFWGPTTGAFPNPDGHVGMSLGGGTIISSEERASMTIHTFTIASRNNAGYPYLGWLMPAGVVGGGGSGGTQFISILQGTTMWAKAGINDAWVKETTTAHDIQAAGTRFAYRTSANELYVKDGIKGSWVHETGNVSQYVITPKYIVVRSGGTIFVKAGLGDTWTTLTGGAIDVQAAGDRFAFRDAAHTLYAKDGIGGGWYTETGGVDQFSLTAGSLVIRQGGSIAAKAGLGDAWTTLAGGAIDVQATGDRIGFLDAARTLHAKQGIGGAWYTEAGNISQYVVGPDYVTIRQGATVSAKTGLGDSWTTLTTVAVDFKQVGSRFAFRNASHVFYVRDSIGGYWVHESSNISQYALSSS